MNNYRVSIIIPIYNVEPYIKQCLQSVASQTMTEGLECILLDDCGTDNSIRIAEQFIAGYKGNIDFRILHHKYNRGLSAARNTGIQAANGEYLYFLDSDDEIIPDCMELMWGLAKQYGDADLVLGSFFKSEKEKATISTFNISEYSIDQAYIKTVLLNYLGDIIAAANKLVRKDFIQEHKLYFKEGIIHEDNYWTFFLAKKVTSMCFCKKRTYYHRNNPNSITRNKNYAKECLAYQTIINELCDNIDTFLPGKQKEYILSNFITAINGNYFDSKVELKKVESKLFKVFNKVESYLLYLYLSTNKTFFKTKILHILLRII